MRTQATTESMPDGMFVSAYHGRSEVIGRSSRRFSNFSASPRYFCTNPFSGLRLNYAEWLQSGRRFPNPVPVCDHSGFRRITLPFAVRQEQYLVVLFHTVSVASFGCRESQSYVVGHPVSIGIAKLRFQDRPNLLQIVAASLVGEALKKIESKSFQVTNDVAG